MQKSAQKILLDSIHFHDIRSTIASKPVAWDALVRAAEVNEFDAEIAKTLESTLVKFSNTNGRLGFSVEQCLSSLIHLLSTSGSQDARRTVVNLITVLLTHDNYVNQALAFFKSSPNMVKSLYEATLSTDSRDDQFVLISSFNVVSLLIQDDLQNDQLVDQLLSNPNYLRVLRNMEQMDTCYVCVRLLQALVGVKRYRLLAWSHEEEFMSLLFQSVGQALEAKSPMRVAANNSNNLGIQSQYYALMIIWLLTFEPSIAAELAVEYLPELLKLLKVVKITIKEKITRLSIAIILNCVAPNVKGRKATIKNLLLLGSGLSIIQQLSERKYSDEELRADLAKLQELLESEYQELTSFDEYVAELDSKLLVWSPPHVDSSFWSENSHRFKENSWKLFKQLLQVLREFSASQDSRHNIAVQVALNDITHIVELQPECVDVLGKLNAKVIIMELLNHPDSKIKYEALKTTQAFVANTFK